MSRPTPPAATFDPVATFDPGATPGGATPAAADGGGLPPAFARWFAARGWSPRPHQLDLLAHARAGASTLLIAPTGAGKTLAGFLPSLVELTGRAEAARAERLERMRAERERRSNQPDTKTHLAPSLRKPEGPGIHTLYISPLKALATDIRRNLEAPVEEMGLPVRLEARTGDTSQHVRQRQRANAPDIMLTTPEQIALLLAHPSAEAFFADLKFVILDELHALVTSKRGHLLSLGLARLRALAPGLRTIGLSATVAEPDELRRWLVAQGPEEDGPDGEGRLSSLVTVEGGAKPDIHVLDTAERIPWQGHLARYAYPEVMAEIAAHKLTIVFVNTRSQAELIFRELWEINEDALPIALHHGSLSVQQRRKVEAAMADGSVRAVIATATLDLGLDWGDVDLVIHIGAPKGASRLAQRIGRSNHRMDEPSKAILVPANRFEVLECMAALNANYLGHQDTPKVAAAAFDVLAQHVMGMACAGGFRADALYAEVTSASPFADVSRSEFDRTVEFVATGGYALRAYDRYAKIRLGNDGLWKVTHPSHAQRYRMNAGTIVEMNSLNIRMSGKTKTGAPVGARRGGPTLGKIEEGFLETLEPGDTFMFAGQTLRFEGIRDNECHVSKAEGFDPKVPYYSGSKFPLTTFLAAEVRRMIAEAADGVAIHDQVDEWLQLQNAKSVLPGPDDLLVETFEHGIRHFLVAYPFEGRLAHQTLGMLLTRRLDRAGARPMGFVATDYALAIWAMKDMGRFMEAGKRDAQGLEGRGLKVEDLFDPDMLGDDLEEWMEGSFMLKRTFRQCAQIAGLVHRKAGFGRGGEMTGRQVTISTDLIYDVLRSHEPDHILLKATRADAATGLLDVRRLSDMLERIQGHVRHVHLPRISPMAVPIMLEKGREPIEGEASEALMGEAADELLATAAL